MKLSILFCITVVARVRISNGNFVKEIKLFDVIDLDNAPGVSRTTGSIPNAPAYSFTDNTTDLAANQSISSLFARQAFSVNEFTVQAYVKTAIEFEGVLVSFGKDKSTSLAVGVRWLRGKSNTIVIEISYIDPSGQSFTDSKEMTVRGLEKNDWFFVSVRVHILEHLFRFAINRVVFDHSRIALGKFPVNGTLRLAQELLASNEGVPKILNRLNGDLQNVTIIFGPPSCDDVYAIPTASPTKSTLPVAPATCPTPKTVVNKCTDANGNEHDNGQEWKEGQCVKCSCKMGKTRCIQFCKMCTFEGEFRIEGSSWNDSTCEKSCECKDGNVLCSYPGVYERKRNGCPRTCADKQSGPCPHTTYDGCFCKGGKLMYNGKCIDRFECPCEHNGKEYANGAQELQGCQYCMCTSGEWKCDTVC